MISVAGSVRGLAVALVIGLWAYPGQTQAAQGPAATTQGQDASLEEVIVTARRRTERLQDVPISVSALGAADLQARSLVSTGELGRAVPNLTIDPASTTKNAYRAYIRGVGQTDFLITSEPGVGMYLDGVYLSRLTGGIMSLLDIDRIEVLRGPQGTLFGRNTTGGAISIVTRKPQQDLEGEISGSAGNYDARSGRVMVNAPLGDRAAGRLSLLRSRSDGYFVNTYSGERLSDTDVSGARGSLLVQPAGNVELTLVADYVRQRESSLGGECLLLEQTTLLRSLLDAVTGFDAACAATTGTSKLRGQSNLPGRSDLDTWGVSVIGDFDLGPVTLKSITAWRGLEAHENRDLDQSPISFLEDYVGPTEQAQVSQELQLIGQGWDGRLDWVGGLYGLREASSERALGTLAPDLAFLLGDGFTQTSRTSTRNVTYAAYGEMTLAVTDRVSLSAGLRYSVDDKRMRKTSRLASSGALVFRGDGEEDYGAWTPRLVAQYQAADDVMLYASWSRGFKSGGFNGRATSELQLDPFGDERLSAWEGGVKSGWLDNRLQVNAAVFYSDYQDIQLTVNRLVPETASITAVIENAAEATIRGLELEIVARPVAGLLLSGGLGLTDAEYDEWMDIDPLTGQPVDRSGLDFQSTPKFDWNLSLEYAFALGNLGQVTARSDYARRGAIYHDAFNTDLIRQGGYGLWNARIGLETDSGVGVALWAKNIGDTRYLTGAIATEGSLGFGARWWGPPRSYGVDLTYRF
jgi:iron complex outermembrane recepter protein